MSRHLTLSVSLLLSLLAGSAAFADDEAVNVVGPSGRSSIALTENTFDYNNDAYLRGTTTLGGNDHQTGDTLDVSGVYAISSKVNITASLYRDCAAENTFTWMGNRDITNQDGVGEDLGVSAVVIDHGGPGFKLVAAAGATHFEGFTPVYYANLEPQYRFDDALLLTSSFGVQHESGYAGSAYAALNLVWKITSSFSVVPSVGVTRYRADGYWSGYTQSTEELSATYHIDHHWSVSASVTHGSDTTQTSDFYANDLANAHSYNYGVGLRRSF